MSPAQNQSIQKMLDLLRRAKADPLRAQLLMSEVEQEALTLSQGGGQLPWRTLRVPNLPALTAAGTPGAISNTGRAVWPQRVFVVAAYGCVLADPWATGAGSTSVGFQVSYAGGDSQLIVNGAGADFMLFFAAFGPNQNWYPIGEIAEGADATWQVAFRNLHAANTYTPEFYFRYIKLPPK